jgi:hypothetical protein
LDSRLATPLSAVIVVSAVAGYGLASATRSTGVLATTESPLHYVTLPRTLTVGSDVVGRRPGPGLNPRSRECSPKLPHPRGIPAL